MKNRVVEIKFNILEAFQYCEKFYSKNRFEISSSFPTINTVGCTLFKQNDHFVIQLDNILSIGGDPAQYQHDMYGLGSNFELISPLLKLSVTNGIVDFNWNVLRGNISGTIQELTSFSPNHVGFYRAIIPTKKGCSVFVDDIESVEFETEERYYAKGHSRITIDNSIIAITVLEYKKNGYFVIDNVSNLQYSKFITIVESILYSLGLITGFLELNEATILTSNDPTFKDIIGLNFLQLEKSQSGIAVILPFVVRHYFPNVPGHGYFPLSSLELMVSKCCHEEKYLQIIRLICQSYESPLEIRATILSVALESIRNILNQTSKENINPIKKQFVSIIKNKMVEVINAIDNEYFNDKGAVLKKINQLNQRNNTISLFSIFEALKIQLFQDDIECINRRNTFLHGTFPIDKEITIESSILHSTYKLHFLVTSALFKMASYSGPIVNYESYQRRILDTDNLESVVRFI